MSGSIAITFNVAFSSSGSFANTTATTPLVLNLPYNSATPNVTLTFNPRLGTLSSDQISVNYTLLETVMVNSSVDYYPNENLFAGYINFNQSFALSTNWGAPNIIFSDKKATYTSTSLSFTGSQISNSTNPGDGGPIVWSYSANVLPVKYNLGGSYSYSGQLATQQVYVPKSPVQYIDDALINNPGTSDYDTAVRAYSDIITLRETSAATSSQNLNLRDAEYFLRDYAGGLANLNAVPFNIDTSSFDSFKGSLLDRSSGPGLERSQSGTRVGPKTAYFVGM